MSAAPGAPTITTIRELVPAGVDQVRVVLDPPPGFVALHTHPGQYCELGPVGGERAPYALLAAPHERMLAFLVKTTSEPGTTLARLGAGDHVEVTPPSGAGFDLDRARGRDVVFVATGTGIAPIRAALETVLLDRDRHGALTLYYGVRDDRFVSVAAAIARWEAAGVVVRVHHSRPSDLRAPSVYVQHAIAEDAPDPAHTRFVVAGHDALVDALVAYVVARGGTGDDILTNY